MIRKTYRALRGAREDNVWSPGSGQWFVTLTLFRSNWGVWRWRRPVPWVKVGLSVLGSWLRPISVPFHFSGFAAEFEPPYRQGRGISLWLWGRTHLVIGRWAPSGYDPDAELASLLAAGDEAVDDLGLDFWNGRTLADLRTD